MVFYDDENCDAGKFKQGDTDITPLLTRIKASEAGAIMSWCAGPTAIILTKNWHHLGIEKPLFADIANASDFGMDFLKKR